jgi:dipeptidase D
VSAASAAGAPSPLATLEPRSIWRPFDELRAIPRASKREERARAWVREIFASRGGAIREDATGNMVVSVPATAGLERGPVVILQAHLDMVTEKNSDVAFDWERDPIQVWIDGDWVKAKGTTLGADNGIGVAAAIATALDPAVEHGPLELLFTVDEETGLTGAMGLDPSLLSGRILINLDSEDDGVLCVGCAGGTNTLLAFEGALAAPRAGSTGATIRVAGLAGGHSGGDIHLNRANALKLLARFFARAAGGAPEPGAARGRDLELEIASIAGGDKHNAIPREAAATVAVPRDHFAALEALAVSERERALAEFATSDPDVRITVEAAAGPARVFARDDGQRLLDFMSVVPSGVIAMSRDIRGLVETSNNLASVRTDGARVALVTSSRSSVAVALRGVLDHIAAAARLAGIAVTEKDGYPGWQPDMASPLLETCRRVYRDLYGEEARVEAVHAGLETALIGKKIPGIRMISYGPDIRGPHSPDERVSIPSVARFWDYHRAVVKALAKV